MNMEYLHDQIKSVADISNYLKAKKSSGAALLLSSGKIRVFYSNHRSDYKTMKEAIDDLIKLSQNGNL